MVEVGVITRVEAPEVGEELQATVERREERFEHADEHRGDQRQPGDGDEPGSFTINCHMHYRPTSTGHLCRLIS